MYIIDNIGTHWAGQQVCRVRIPEQDGGWQAPDKERSSGGNWQRRVDRKEPTVTVTSLGASGISPGSEMGPKSLAVVSGALCCGPWM